MSHGESGNIISLDKVSWKRNGKQILDSVSWKVSEGEHWPF